VAGRFYPAGREALGRLVRACLEDVPAESRRAVGVLVPHAGFEYSGRCAGKVFGRIQLPPTIVILAPNHTGRCRSPGASIWRAGAFVTPLGSVVVDEAFADALTGACDLVADDPSAHAGEHAIEVELPFIQVLTDRSRIVPIVLAWDDWARCERLAGALADVARAWPDDVLLVASTDMTHFESARSAAQKDGLALAAVARLDGQELLDVCHRDQVSMCGRAPAAVVLDAARRLGATRAELVDYRHSGLVTGDTSDVVAYAGVVIS
jgi:AmmeMemoRadiSam system protein B